MPLPRGLRTISAPSTGRSKQRKKNGKYVGEEIDAPLELDGAAFGDGYPTPEQQAIIDEMMTIPEGTVPDDPLDFLPGRQG